VTLDNEPQDRAVPTEAGDAADTAMAEAIQSAAATEAAPGEAEPAAGAAASRRRATRSRTTKKAAKAATPEASPEPATAESPAPSVEGETEAEKPAKRARAPRKRAAAKTAPRASAEAAVGVPAADTEAAQPAGPTEATEATGAAPPAKKTTRRRSTRKASAPAAASLFDQPEASGAHEPEPSAPPDESPDQTDAQPDEELATVAAEETGEVVEPLEGDDEDDEEIGEETGEGSAPRRRRRRGGRGRRGRGRTDADADEEAEGDEPAAEAVEEDGEGESGEEASAEDEDSEDGAPESTGSRRRRRRRRRGSSGGDDSADDPPNTVVKVRESRRDDVTAIRGSTRLEAKKQRRREGREAGKRRTILTEAEFLTRRESVERVMVVREREGRTQIGVLEDGVLVEHYVARKTQTSTVGNVYLGRVQNVLPSMEAAFIDIGKGRNAVLYAGEVNWDAAGLDGQPRRIEHALKAGEPVLVQVTKDPVGHKGARLTSQISMPGRYLVYVPDGSMTGISRKLPDTERSRLKKILREIVPDDAGVIVRTAAEGASDEELERDVARLRAQWDDISAKIKTVQAPALLYGEPDLAIRVVRDIFNEDFGKLIVSGDDAWDTLDAYIGHVAPDLAPRLERWTSDQDVFAANRIDEQLAKAMDRKVWLPSGGSLVIDRTEAMTVVDVNTGKFTGSGGNLEETVTKNNLEAVEEVVRQLRLRDIGGIIVVDFIDMVLESNRDLVLRRLLECLGRDRTRHQVAEVTSLGLVQMTRKRVGQGLLEVFSETCEHCGGRGLIIHDEPVEKRQQENGGGGGGGGRSKRH
jgi:ribonuclease E